MWCTPPPKKKKCTDIIGRFLIRCDLQQRTAKQTNFYANSHSCVTGLQSSFANGKNDFYFCQITKNDGTEKWRQQMLPTVSNFLRLGLRGKDLMTDWPNCKQWYWKMTISKSCLWYVRILEWGLVKIRLEVCRNKVTV